jgi:cell division septation protein DedD
MDIKFSKDSAGSQQEAGDNKGKQNVLLVVLLVLVGVFAYIYFFTGLIKPLPEQKVAEAPAASQAAKQPLPSPDGTPSKPDVGAGEAKMDAAAPAVKPAPVQEPPAAAPVAVAKPAVQEAAKAKEEPKAAGAAQPAVKKPLPSVVKAGAKKPEPVEKTEQAVAEKKPKPVVERKAQAVAEKKPQAVAEKKPLPVKYAEKKPAEVKKPVEKQAAAVTAVAKVKNARQKPVTKEEAAVVDAAGPGTWTVLVGNYVLEEAMATDLARVRKAGLQAYVVPGTRKKTHMNRLLLAEFTDRDSAEAELAKLKRSTSDAFMIDNDGMHAVYAGSYLIDSRAGSEKGRLAAAGFTLTVKRVDVSIPTKNLTAGSFTVKSAADDVLKKLRTAGVKAALSRQ